MAGDQHASVRTLNPFVPGAGLQPPELVGRERDLEAVTHIATRAKFGLTSQGMVISGLRGMGKTVLLVAMQDAVTREGMVSARIEATGDADRDYDSLFHEIALAAAMIRSESLRDKMLAILPKVESLTLSLFNVAAEVQLPAQERARSNQFKLELLVEQLAITARDEHTGVFVFIDELQEMDSAMLGTLITLQHRMGQESLPFYIIGAGLPNLPGVLSKTRSYAERLFEYRRLDQLDAEDTADGFQKPATRSGRPFDEEALAALVELSCGYPYFIQAYGKAAWNASDSSPIRVDAVRRGEPVARRELDDGLYLSRWQRATAQGREYLAAMASINGDNPLHIERGVDVSGQAPEGNLDDANRADRNRTDLPAGTRQGRIHRPRHGRIHPSRQSDSESGVRQRGVTRCVRRGTTRTPAVSGVDAASSAPLSQIPPLPQLHRKRAGHNRMLNWSSITRTPRIESRQPTQQSRQIASNTGRSSNQRHVIREILWHPSSDSH